MATPTIIISQVDGSGTGDKATGWMFDGGRRVHSSARAADEAHKAKPTAVRMMRLIIVGLKNAVSTERREVDNVNAAQPHVVRQDGHVAAFPSHRGHRGYSLRR